MKKIFILSFLLIVGGNVLGQETSSLGQDVTDLKFESKQDENQELQKRQSSYELHYGFPFANGKMSGGSAGVNGVIKHVLLGLEFLWNKSDFLAIQVPVGANYRYFLGKHFYVEGRAMVGYGHSSIRILGKEVKDNYGYMGVSPRVCTLLGKQWGIAAGYECDFSFKKFGSPSHRVMVGLVLDIDDL
ncbi:MAG: hypothetical protein IJ064_07865 [Bacteroidaceae bacterium]|nr:hypothetical protein [Bacteroidaceae bacterium]